MLKVEVPVCVTGANGYIASELIATLLARGHTVHGTVRSTAPAKTAHLVAPASDPHTRTPPTQ